MYDVVCMTKNCYNGAMASIVEEGILTKSQTGFISAMFYLTYTPLQIFGGVFCDRYSPEKLIKYSLLGAAIANVVIYFNQNYYVILAAVGSLCFAVSLFRKFKRFGIDSIKDM